MLTPVLRANGVDLTTNLTLSDLLASFRTQRPRAAPTLPEWDMAFVLYTLTRAPWEPLEGISLKRLTLKVFFLVLLASGARRSDVSAIDLSRMSYTADGAMRLYPAREFVPKTRAAAEGNKAFAPIVIPPLVGFVGANEPDSCLCPVRAVRIYVSRTNSFRRGRQRLFLSYQRNRVSDITNFTLSMWVKVLVKSVYLESGAADLATHRISAHQVRHLSMSLASRGNIPLEAIIRAGMWTNPTTFLAFYLSSTSEMSAQCRRFRLGPLVVAQSIVV